MHETLHIIKYFIVNPFLLFDWAVMSAWFIAFNPFTHRSSAIPIQIRFLPPPLAPATILYELASDAPPVAIRVFPSVQLIQGMR
jgi:hypothetical protein